MPFKVLVVGGAGGMGRWCARLFKRAGFDVYISSRGDASETACSLGVGISGQSEAGSFDIVVLSVPIDAMYEAASVVGPRMRPGSLLMDLSSLKKGPVDAMLKHAPEGVEVIGTHPLFGPDTDGRGLTIALVPGRGERWLPIIKDLLDDEGFVTVTVAAKEHDECMAVVQGLTHFMYIAMVRSLERSGADAKRASELKTPVFGITYELAGRVLSQSPELYALIQSSEEAGKFRREYMDACRELAQKLDEGDMQGFIEDFKSAARFYGDTAGARKRSDRIIKREIVDRLSIMDSIGRERAFSYDGQMVYGIIKDAGTGSFTLETPDGILNLKYEDVTPASESALQSLKASVARYITRDIVVKMPIGADPEVLKWALSKIDGVRCDGTETTDALGPEHILYRFAIIVPAEGSEEALQKVLKTIWGLGLEVK